MTMTIATATAAAEVGVVGEARDLARAVAVAVVPERS
jgi:hypothetical protein